MLKRAAPWILALLMLISFGIMVEIVVGDEKPGDACRDLARDGVGQALNRRYRPDGNPMADCPTPTPRR